MCQDVECAGICMLRFDHTVLTTVGSGQRPAHSRARSWRCAFLVPLRRLPVSAGPRPLNWLWFHQLQHPITTSHMPTCDPPPIDPILHKSTVDRIMIMEHRTFVHHIDVEYNSLEPANEAPPKGLPPMASPLSLQPEPPRLFAPSGKQISPSQGWA